MLVLTKQDSAATCSWSALNLSAHSVHPEGYDLAELFECVLFSEAARCRISSTITSTSNAQATDSHHAIVWVKYLEMYSTL